jgi:hypothetical protein
MGTMWGGLMLGLKFPFQHHVFVQFILLLVMI